jgi:maltose alpha-D-glucosyltransferase/alpha-amylase
MPGWLEDAVFYEIYPQSFYDTNGDGIGDFEGIIQKLDYIKDLGCNALWINPCFDSPFKDAGYDVRDYKKTAPRYGSNEDLKRLFAEAHRRGIRALLDLVPGHTSEEHPWFRESGKAEPNEYSNRFIWTDHWFMKPEGLGYVAGEAEREAVYIVNFFKCQPALNYGFLKPSGPWQLPMDHPDCIVTREAMKEVMRFWLDAGCDGFRADMAASLVKNDDEKKTGTSAIWRDIREMLDRDYPEAALVAEWGAPELSVPAGFHADFLLSGSDQPKAYTSLLRDYEIDRKYNLTGEDKSFFKKEGRGDIKRFLDDYLRHYETASKNGGYVALISCNHDTIRPRFNLSYRELALYYGFLFTMPGTPFLYYGDEIGMRYLKLPTKEGGYFRTGSRTPMQWSQGANLGFSTAKAEDLYLPVDTAPDTPTVEEQEKDEDSLLHTIKALLHLRHREPALQAKPNLEILYAEKGKLPFVYRRGGFVAGINPSGKKAQVSITIHDKPADGNAVYTIGTGSLEQGMCTLGPQSFALWRI